MNSVFRAYLHSEKFSADGNISAEGFEKLLGAPSLDLLAILAREAVQNCCDATRKDSNLATVKIRARTLSEEQRTVLKDSFFSSLPLEKTASEHLKRILYGTSPLNVLEISDYGTSGLGGPTRGDHPLAEGENADFVNFFRNIGAARDVEAGGGTYGYGKATLYRASEAHTILVDTVTTENGSVERRLMGSQMGVAIPGQFTGRHWWGTQTADGSTADPIRREQAEKLSEALGMPSRSNDRGGLGTTIMILAPHMPESCQKVIAALQEYLLWNFWPRMMETPPPLPAKGLQIFTSFDENDWVSLPKPEDFPPLDVLCSAMNALRNKNSDLSDIEVSEIHSERPAAFLGKLSIAKSRAKNRKWLLPPRATQDSDELTSIIPERLRHVALMRPAQLVVKYEVGGAHIDPNEDWGGVFICSNEKKIEEAFAKSEPPAHDDWLPEVHPSKSWERRYVKIALKRIRDKLVEGRTNLDVSDVQVTPLARVSSEFGKALPSARGQGAGRARATPGTGRPPKKRILSQPVFTNLSIAQDIGPCAEFEFEVYDLDACKRIEASTFIVVDGKMIPPDPAIGVPKVVHWTSPSRGITSSEAVSPSECGLWKICITLPGSFSVSVKLEASVDEVLE